MRDKYQIKVLIGTDALLYIFANENTKLGDTEFIYRESPIYDFHVGGKINNTSRWVKNKPQAPLISKDKTDKAIKFNNFEKSIGWSAVFKVKKSKLLIHYQIIDLQIMIKENYLFL